MNYLKLSFIFLLTACSSHEEDPPAPDVVVSPGNSFSKVRLNSNLINGDLGLKGYDPVGYFVSDAALVGNQSINSSHDDIRYNFSSIENKELFDVDPEKYVPQYGGWCATGWALNLANPSWTAGKYDIDPNTFSVENGKLYVFFNFPSYNAYPDWVDLGDEIRMAADQNWGDLVK